MSKLLTCCAELNIEAARHGTATRFIQSDVDDSSCPTSGIFTLFIKKMPVPPSLVLQLLPTSYVPGVPLQMVTASAGNTLLQVVAVVAIGTAKGGGQDLYLIADMFNEPTNPSISCGDWRLR